MSTFIGQLIGFAVIVFIIVKWVVPPVRDLMRRRQDTIGTQLTESEQAAKRLADADAMYDKTLEDAKAQAARVTEEARQDREHITAQLAEQADAEAERIRAQGGQQVELARRQLIRNLRGDLGEDAVAAAARLVREHVEDSAAQAATIDRFLDELDGMAPTPVPVQTGAAIRLRASSRASQEALTDEFDGVIGDLDAEGLGELADELTAVARLLLGETALAKHLAEPGEETEHKVAFVDRLFSGKVGDGTRRLIGTAATQRWSVDADLVGGVEHLARLALLKRAELDGDVDEVEEQLFRIGRVLDQNPRLATLLGDYTTPADGRVALLDGVLGNAGDLNSTAHALVSQTIGLLRGERADEAVIDLAELTVARRGEVVAHVTAPAPPSDAQTARLADVLTRIYGHPVSVQLHVDPELLGGLSIAVGDEVIDGSIASRLSSAKTQLPD